MDENLEKTRGGWEKPLRHQRDYVEEAPSSIIRGAVDVSLLPAWDKDPLEGFVGYQALREAVNRLLDKPGGSQLEDPPHSGDP